MSDQPIKLNRRNTREENVIETSRAAWESPEIKGFRESFKKQFGFDFKDTTKLPVLDRGFSWGDAARGLGTTVREADSGSSFAQVLRAGVQSIVNSMYESVAVSHDDWVHVVQSQKDTELYAPLHGLSFMREIGKQEQYPEARAAGLDIKLKNRKYGTHYAVEKELIEDDQTGQFSKQVGLLGEYAKLALEVLVMAKLASVSGAAYAEMQVPTTETQPDDEAVYPFAPPATPFVGGGSNRPATFTLLNQGAIQAGHIALLNQKNKLGLKMGVDPKRLLIGPAYNFDAKVLLNSAWYPSVPSATAGAVGTNYANNELKGLYNLTVSRFMFKNDGTVTGDSKAWYLMDDTKPWFVLQIRQAAEVQQEANNAGKSFDQDVMRFKVSIRANADHIDPRFCYQGNNGSVIS